MKLTFFSAHSPAGERIVGKTRRDVRLALETLGSSSEPKKITVVFRDNFELLTLALRGAL